jgi:hypothetical protein
MSQWKYTLQYEYLQLPVANDGFIEQGEQVISPGLVVALDQADSRCLL